MRTSTDSVYAAAPPSNCVIVSARVLREIIATRRPRGPDRLIAAARWVLWVALAETEHEAQWVHASPAEVARSYCGRAVGLRMRRRLAADGTSAMVETQMEHDGMSESALARLRPYILERGWLRVSRSGGKYRTIRSTEHYAWPVALVRRMVFDYSAAELRAALAMAPSLSAAQDAGRETVRAVARACAPRTGQGVSRWADAVCGLRNRGDVRDNRPTKVLTCTPDGFRYEPRIIRLDRTRLCPLARPLIRYPQPRAQSQEDRNGHSEMDTEHPIQLSVERESSAHEPEEVASLRAATDETPCDDTSEAMGSPSEPAHAPRTHDGQRLRHSPESYAKVRQLIAAELDGIRASERTCRQVVTACGSLNVLRAVIDAKRGALAQVDNPQARAAYIGQVCEGEGAAVQDPRWSRRRPRSRVAEHIPPDPAQLRADAAVAATGGATRALVAQLRDIGDHAAAAVVLARCEAAEHEARAAQDWQRAEATPQEDIAAALDGLRATLGAWEYAHAIAPLRAVRVDRVRRHVTLIAPESTLHAEEHADAIREAMAGWTVQLRAAGDEAPTSPTAPRSTPPSPSPTAPRPTPPTSPTSPTAPRSTSPTVTPELYPYATPAARLLAWMDARGIARRPGSA